MIELRRALESEIEWVNQRYAEVDFVPSSFSREVIAIAEMDGQVAGLGRLVAVDGSSLELGGMFVFEKYRKQGIARKIVEFLLQEAPINRTIYCIPFEHLTCFYTQYGFRVCEHMESVPKEVLEKCLWCKKYYPKPTSLLVRTL